MKDHLGTGPGGTGAPGPPRLTGRLDDRLTRLGVTGRFTRDCLLAAGATVMTFVLMTALFWFVARTEDLTFDPTRVRLIVAVCCVQAMLLCLRRVRPLLCLALVVGLQVLIIAMIPTDATVHGIPPLVAAYTVGTLWPVRAAFLVAGTAVVVETAGTVLLVAVAHPDPLFTAISHLTSSVLSYLGAAFVGGYVATRRRYVELVRVQADEAIRAQQATMRAAIGAERSRMARELHDVAAHHLSGMVVQAAAVERLIDRDPAAAKAGVAWIRTQGKETLDNLRLVVGVLRGRRAGDDAADHTDSNAPVPGLAMLDDLVQTARELSTPVELVREGEPREVPPIADVALYRVVQESLSNARQHAPGAPVRVVLRFLPREVSLEVVNAPGAGRPEPATRTSSGVGLVGMRERAQLIGAQLAAGPTAAGGWCVRVTLPTVRDGAQVPPVAARAKGHTPA